MEVRKYTILSAIFLIMLGTAFTPLISHADTNRESLNKVTFLHLFVINDTMEIPYIYSITYQMLIIQIYI